MLGLLPRSSIVIAVALALSTVVGSAETSPPEVRWPTERPPVVTARDYGFVLRKIAVDGSLPELSALPRGMVDDRHRRVVFLTTRRGNGAVRKTRGAGAGIVAALRDAARKLPRGGIGRSPLERLRLDVVYDVSPLQVFGKKTRFSSRLGIEGLAFPEREDAVLLPDEVLAGVVLTDKARIHRERLARTVGLPFPGELRGRRFRSEAYFFDGESTARLYRGRRPRYRFDSGELLAAAKSGGDYLVRACGDDGEFVYTYWAHRDAETTSYNLVRHAGTIFALLELHAAAPDPRVLAAAERAIDYLLRFVRPYSPPEDRVVSAPRAIAVVVEGDKLKLGGVALAVLALTQHAMVAGGESAERHAAVRERLARYLVAAQKPSGEFICQRYMPSGKVRDWTSEYYPGEAIFALARLHALDGREEWLGAAERGADFLIKVRDKGVKTLDLIHDHWLLYGLNELGKFRVREPHTEHAFRIVTAIAASQKQRSEHPDHLGSYYDPPRSTPTATRCEGLLAAHEQARRAGRDDVARDALAVAIRCVAFQLQTQFTPASTFFLRRPGAALGGFSSTLTKYDIRIDYVQHNVSAILALRRELLRSGVGTVGPGFEFPR